MKLYFPRGNYPNVADKEINKIKLDFSSARGKVKMEQVKGFLVVAVVHRSVIIIPICNKSVPICNKSAPICNNR